MSELKKEGEDRDNMKVCKREGETIRKCVEEREREKIKKRARTYTLLEIHYVLLCRS